MAIFERTDRGVRMSVPHPVALLLAAMAQDTDGQVDHPLEGGPDRPLAYVPGAETDPLANLEAEMAADAMRAHRADIAAQQNHLVLSLTRAPVIGGVTVKTFTDEQAALLLGWCNTQYVRSRTLELDTVAVGSEQSALGLMGLAEQAELDEAEAFVESMGPKTMLFVALSCELAELL